MKPIEIKQKLEDVTEAALMPDRPTSSRRRSPLAEIQFMDSGGFHPARGNGKAKYQTRKERRANAV